MKKTFVFASIFVVYCGASHANSSNSIKSLEDACSSTNLCSSVQAQNDNSYMVTCLNRNAEGQQQHTIKEFKDSSYNKTIFEFHSSAGERSADAACAIRSLCRSDFTGCDAND